METHYLIDMHTDRINLVRSTLTGLSDCTGHYIVRVPATYAISPATTLASLVTNKYDALLANYPMCAHKIYDAFLDATGLDPAALNTAATFGERNTVSIYPAGYLETNTFALAVAPDPVQAVVCYELFEYVDTSPRTGAHVRQYTSLASSAAIVACEVSFNAGATYLPVTDGAILNIPGPDQGTDLRLRFHNVAAPAKRVFLGSWAVLY